MTQYLITIFHAFIIKNGAIAIFGIGVLEDFLFFVPSSLVFMGAGFALISQDLNFLSALWLTTIKIGVPASLGVTFGSIFIYGLVYKLGKPVVDKFGKYLGVRWEEIESVRNKFAKGYSDEVALFIMRALPVFPLSIASILSGLVRLGWKEFVSITFIGVYIRATASAMIGWRVGKTYVYYAEQFEIIERYGLVAILLCITGFLIWHLKKHSHKVKD